MPGPNPLVHNRTRTTWTLWVDISCRTVYERGRCAGQMEVFPNRFPLNLCTHKGTVEYLQIYYRRPIIIILLSFIIIIHHYCKRLLLCDRGVYIYLCARIVKHDNALMYVLFTLLCPRPSRHNIIIHRPSHMKRRRKRWFPGHKDGLSCAPCKLYRLCMVDGIRLKMWLLTHIALRLRTDVANFRFRTNSKQ